MSEFATGAYVRKSSGAFWEGTVVGRYSTRQTDDGIAVQLFGWEDGPVQIYPASALEPCDPAEGRLAPQLLTVNLSEDELANLQAMVRDSVPGRITVATPPPQTHVLKSDEPENGSERDAIDHGAVLSSDFKTLPVYDVVGHDLLRQYLPSGLDGFLMGVFERGELRAFRIFLKGATVTNMEVIPGHVVSILPIQNEAVDSQFPPPPSSHVGVR